MLNAHKMLGGQPPEKTDASDKVQESATHQRATCVFCSCACMSEFNHLSFGFVFTCERVQCSARLSKRTRNGAHTDRTVAVALDDDNTY